MCKFLVNNNGIGPFAEEVSFDKIEIGDIAQLSFDGNTFSHTLFIVEEHKPNALENIFVATHTFDSYGRSISSYDFEKIRFIHIKGVRDW